jgi:transcriptional regulator with XRE-family HTH domain
VINNDLGSAIKKALGQNIKEFRSQRGFSQMVLAEKADISITFLSNIERGLKYPTAQVLGQIAAGLGVEVWQLYKGEATVDDSKDIVTLLSADLKEKVNEAMDTIFKKYGSEA